MTEKEIEEQIQAIKRITDEASKSKESALQMLIDAGILEPPSDIDAKSKKKEL